MKKYWVIGLLFTILLGCQHRMSLQKFYVNHQDNKNFLVIDIPASLLYKNDEELPEEIKIALSHIQKANVLALPLNGCNREQYKTALHKLLRILNQKEYKLLFKLQFSGMHFRVQYVGAQNAIDELVITAYANDKGFVVARLIGSDMNANAVINVLKAAHSGKLNINSFHDVMGGNKDK